MLLCVHLLVHLLSCHMCIASMHLFLFHRDEPHLLRDWVEYHARLVSYQNIHIIDNMSSAPAVVSILKSLQLAGVGVQYVTGPYEDQGRMLTQSMRGFLNSTMNVTHVVPMDTDEFLLGINDDGQWTTADATIHRIVTGLPADGHQLKLRQIRVVACDPNGEGVVRGRVHVARHFLPLMDASCMDKTYYAAKGFIRTNNGNHHGNVAADDSCSNKPDLLHCWGVCFWISRLAIAHFRGPDAFPTYELYKRKMLRDYHAMPDVHAADPTCGAFGTHVCRFHRDWQAQGDAAMKAQFTARRKELCYDPLHLHNLTYSDSIERALLNRTHAET